MHSLTWYVSWMRPMRTYMLLALTPNQLLKGRFSEFEMMEIPPDESDDIGDGFIALY
jgi:hypothetical protein